MRSVSRVVIASLPVLAVAAVTGCFTDPYDYHPGFQPFPLVEGPPMEIRASPGSVGIRFETGEYREPCARLLETFNATVSGVAMQVHRGDATDYGLDSPDWVCDEPSAGLTLPDPGPENAVLELADESTTLRIELGNALATRTMQFVDGTEWTRGYSYAIAWTPISDLPLQRPESVAILVNSEWVDLHVAYEESQIRVAMPQPGQLPYNGGANMIVSWGDVLPPPCLNCRLIVTGRLDAQITIR